MVQIIQSSPKVPVYTKVKEVSCERLLHWAIHEEFVFGPVGLSAAEAVCDGTVMKDRSPTAVALDIAALGCRVDRFGGPSLRVADDAMAVGEVLNQMPDVPARAVVHHAVHSSRPPARLPGVLRLVPDADGDVFGFAWVNRNRKKVLLASGVRAIGPLPQDQEKAAQHHADWLAGLTELRRRLRIEGRLKKHRLVAVLDGGQGGLTS